MSYNIINVLDAHFKVVKIKQWVNVEIRGNFKISWEKWQWKHNHTKSTEGSKSSPKRDVHSDRVLLPKKKKTGKYQIKNLTHHLKELEKEQTKPKLSRRRKIIKEEINKAEFKQNNRKKQ